MSTTNTEAATRPVTVALDTVAASLVPRMVTVTLLLVPSTLVTENVSFTEAPTFRRSKALLAWNVHCPSELIANAPV